MINANSPTAVAGEADSVSSLSASACHIGGPIDINPGQLMLLYSISGQNSFSGHVKKVKPLPKKKN